MQLIDTSATKAQRPYFTVKPDVLARWVETYPDINVAAELSRAECWCRANLEERVSMYWVEAWLRRAAGNMQDFRGLRLVKQ